MAMIHEKLVAISRDVQAIGKDSKNQQQGFMFRGIDAVMNELHPIFAKHGVIILPKVIEDRSEERQTKNGGNLIYRILKTEFKFIAEDGTAEASTILSEGMDSGDKAVNKALAVGLKYALTQMLLLPYDEVDPDADTPPQSVKKAAQPIKQAVAPKEAPKEPVKVKTAPTAGSPVPALQAKPTEPEDDLPMTPPAPLANNHPPKAAGKQAEEVVDVTSIGKPETVKTPYGQPNTGSPQINAGTKAKILAAFGKHNIPEAFLEQHSGFPIAFWTEEMKRFALADYTALENGMNPTDVFIK